jgi:predicted helicase
MDTGLFDEYEEYWTLSNVFTLTSTGVKTHRDHFSIGFDKESLKYRFNDFVNINMADDAIQSSYNLPDTRDWKLSQKRKASLLELNFDKDCRRYTYRPFDSRFIIYSSYIVELTRDEIMKHLCVQNNVALGIGRQGSAIGNDWDIIFVTKNPIDTNIFRRGGVQVFPVYLSTTYLKGTQKQLTDKFNSFDNDYKIPNLNPDFVSAFASRLGLSFVSDGHGDLSSTFGPEDIFDYIYALFHSLAYRQRYAEFLKIDFPRVPMTSSPELFRKLCVLGEELVALHLLESPYLSQLITRYPVVGDNIVEKGFPKFVAYEEGAPGYVHINKAQYFEGVPKQVWEFHIGGYQVCEKWLKDRRGRQLSFDDLMHYQKVVVALKETIRLMAEIDRAIPGWPIE